MFERLSFQTHPHTCPVLDAGTDVRPARHIAADNQLLAALPVADLERLLPDLEPVSLPLGWSIHDAGERQQFLYFFAAGIACRFNVTENGASAGFAVTGCEGVIGIASFLGGETTPSHAEVMSAGHAFRLPTRLLKSEFEHDGALPKLLLRYTRMLFAQIGQVAVCNRHHSLDQQLSRWILSCLDRLPSGGLAMTQKRIAKMLGVRRESVTEAAGGLQRAGLIRCGRGYIDVLDRARLEARACECYAVVRWEFDCLLAEYRRAKALARSG